MKKYDSYKNSGAEWIGEIPNHWDIYKVKNLIDRSLYYQVGDGDHGSIKPEMYQDHGIPYIRVQNLSWSGKLLLENVVFISEEIQSLNPKSKLLPNDILIAKTGATVGKLGLITNDITEANTTSSVGKLTVDKNRFCPKFILYSFQADFFQKELWLKACEKSAQPGFNIDDFVLFKISSPKLSEQTIIANYLDHKTTQIDILISKKQQFINLLQEERIAIINQAVTKGLDPNVPMKDSGIEWLGEIPEHWEVKKLKFLLNENKDALKTGPFGSHIKNSDYIPNGEFKVYTQRNVLDSEYENGCESITEEKFNELKGFSVFEGDILITTRGSIGRCSEFPKGLPLGILHPCLIRIQVNEKLSLKNWVINYINNTSLFYNNVKYNSNSTIIDVIYGYTLKEIFFPVPTINEQREILYFLEIKIDEIETLISKSQQEIELLKEYKTALISEVVSGKVDVRNEKLN